MPASLSPKKAKKGNRRKAKVKKVPRFTKEELNEEIDTFLTTYNPYMSENCVEFDRKTQSFKQVLDYRKPVLAYKLKGIMKKKLPEAVEILYAEAEREPEEEKEEKMRNKFNYRSVATQTPYINPTESGNQIDSSQFPVLKFKATASKAEIIAAYEKHEKQKEEEKEYEWINHVLKKISMYIGRKTTPFQDANKKCLRLCERIVDQNLSEANLDFTYYDNPNDEFRPDLGSLLPLWSFSCPQIKGLPVTAIAFSAQFIDMFAVGFRNLKEDGECDEDDLGLVREKGCVCVYSLKGAGHPEKIIWYPSAVRSLSFHPSWPHLLATGSESAVVSVYDLRRDEGEPAGTNDMLDKILHQDAVCELRWLLDPLPQKFCTISADGKVLNWLFLLNDLFPSEEVISLYASEWSGEAPPKGIEVDNVDKEEASYDMGIRMAGKSMSVNPNMRDMFAVGTESGLVYQCSFNVKSLQRRFEDHKSSVIRVHWNPYHPRVFLSCSEDMTIRVWDSALSECIFDFFFDNDVRDARWAPFSSTLFAAISGNAMVYVFDLAMNKSEAVGSYAVHPPKEGIRLTTVYFHPKRPVLMVGNEKGQVYAFKLSPNLRSSLKARETMEEAKFVAGEVQKMEKLLAPSKGRPKK